MASRFATLTLHEIYSQVQQSTPCAVFALKPDHTPHDLKLAYRALALRLHPDKCSHDNLRDFHSDLFKRVQDAYEQLLSKGPDPTPPASSTRQEDSTATHNQNDEFAPFETKPTTCRWSAEDFKRYFRAMDEVRAREEAMWEEIERPKLPKRKIPCMSKGTAERVRRVRQERCAEHERFLMRYRLDMRLWDLAEARLSFRKRRVSLQAGMKGEQMPIGDEGEQEWEE
ncbi:hypothetical protein AC578_1616 [Pseudocercospora eumusae]|uniref:J domain-containing protein n=1 Tax=Pseudocercospora eumusae TaxID=321146 RepID=A0A139HM14_9PEZI|nr:hypothetical protein AC578_1616 [Pseudocercospora eumusae]